MNKTVWKVIFWANWAVIAGFWWSNSGGLLWNGAAGIAIAFGRLAGLAAAYMILLQFFFMGRTPYLERAFGLDVLSRIHHTNGQRGFFLLLLHPLLLALGYRAFSGESFWGQMRIFFFDYPHVVWAGIGTVFFIVVVATSVYIVRKKLKYESWYFVHLAAYLAVFGSFWHQIAIGSDLLASRIFYWYWIALYAYVFAHHLAFRFIAPVYRFLRHGFFVERIVRENYNTVSIYIGGKDLRAFNIHPGQFMILRFLAKDFWRQSHPFSLSMLPDGKHLRVTVKNLGDFTARVQEIAVGTKILIDGPYGVFTDLFGVSEKVLMIAGGIGITPIRSLMEQFLKQSKDVVLLYANRTQADVVFKKEIDDIAHAYGGKVVYIMSHEKEFSGEKGIVNEEKIKALAPDFRSRDIFLCGPPAMMDAVLAGLRNLGVSLPRIHFEKFSMG